MHSLTQPAPNGAPGGNAVVPLWWEPPRLPVRQRRRPHLVITVPAETLTGQKDLPAELAGYGAITAEAARDLARHAGSADLIVLDGITTREQPHQLGKPPDQPYRPGNATVRRVFAMHQTCRFPGCRRSADQCDLDHLMPYAKGGSTTPGNLIPLCRHHHKLKTHGGWRVQPAPANAADLPLHALRHPPGSLQWISPLGRTYLTPPDDRPGDWPGNRPGGRPDDLPGGRPAV